MTELDIVSRLLVLGQAAEIRINTLDRKHVAALSREAAAEINRLRRKTPTHQRPSGTLRCQ
jgi:hypothetical protein